MTYTFFVDMTCGGCSKAVNAILSKIDGVSNIKIDLENKTVSCDSTNLGADELLKNIQKTGKKCSVIA